MQAGTATTLTGTVFVAIYCTRGAWEVVSLKLAVRPKGGWLVRAGGVVAVWVWLNGLRG